MSYTFTVIKDAEGIRIDEISESMLAYVPDGSFIISGHKVAPGMSSVANLAVTLTTPDRQFVASFAGSYQTKPAED